MYLGAEVTAGSCTGLVAANTTCVNDAYVAEQKNIYRGSTIVGNIQLKYSPSCRATWARVISNLGEGSSAEVVRTGNTGIYEFCAGGDAAGTGCNTPMLNDANVTSYAFGSVGDPNTGSDSAQTASY
jgi:hypothetical protein